MICKMRKLHTVLVPHKVNSLFFLSSLRTIKACRGRGSRPNASRRIEFGKGSSIVLTVRAYKRPESLMKLQVSPRSLSYVI
jgi:hypothetical protein